MVGVQPVDELFSESNFCMQSFRQRNSEAVKEYIDREERVGDSCAMRSASSMVRAPRLTWNRSTHSCA
eukprot:9979885-Lingulodinium_polyedra.AAC.1